jgi:hypothetical protein
MKTYSAPESSESARRQAAQGCFSTNLVMPGLGSLVGGRKVGLFQLALCLCGFVMTLATGIRFIFWSLSHWAEYYNPKPDADPFAPLHDLWIHGRWPVLGTVLFGVAWLWAFSTSRAILADSKIKKGGQP